MNRSIFAALSLICLANVSTATPSGASEPDILSATLAEKDAGTAEVSTAEMRQLLEARNSLVLDTRTRLEFDAGHLPGAVHLEGSGDAYLQEVVRAAGKKAHPLVLYCNGPFCQASRRLAQQLVKAGFSNVRRYQLGIPVWRALGGPVQVEIGGVARVHGHDSTAVFIDVRAPEAFRKDSLAGALNAPIEDIVAGRLTKLPLPEDDFNRRIVIFGDTGGQASNLAQILSKRPWHNVMYFNGSYADLQAALTSR